MGLDFATTDGFCAPESYDSRPTMNRNVVFPAAHTAIFENSPMFDVVIAPGNIVFQDLGLDPSWGCGGDGEGEPFYHVPVLALTATSIVTQGETSILSTSVAEASPAPTRTPSLPVSTLQSDQSTQQMVSGSESEPQSSYEPVSNNAGLHSSATAAVTSPDTAMATSRPPTIGTDGAVAPLPSLPAITVAGSHVTIDAQGSYRVGTNTLTPGGPALTLSGTVVSLAHSASVLVVGTSTISLTKTAQTSKIPAVGGPAGHPVTIDSQGNYRIDGQILQPGGPSVDISGTVYSLFLSATALAVGLSTIPLRGSATPHDGHGITIDGSTITANLHGQYIVGSQTLIPEGAAITVSGTLYSLSPSGTVLQLETSRIPPARPAPPITLGGQTVTADADGDYVISLHTLRPGGTPITVAGTTYSLSPSGTALQVDGSTIPLTTSSEPAAITLGGQAYTADARGDYVIGTQTLRPGGPPVTVSGTTVISMAADGHTVVVNGRTEVLTSTTTSRGIGELVWSGIGGSGSAGGDGGGGLVSGSGSGSGVAPAPLTGKAVAVMGKANAAWVRVTWTVVAFVLFLLVAAS